VPVKVVGGVYIDDGIDATSEKSVELLGGACGPFTLQRGGKFHCMTITTWLIVVDEDRFWAWAWAWDA
jgi:hypothetical protein